MNTSPSQPTTKRQAEAAPIDPSRLVMAHLRQEAERKYPRKLKVLARRLGWSTAKLSKVLAGGQDAKLAELLTLASVLAVPLSQLLKIAGA